MMKLNKLKQYKFSFLFLLLGCSIAISCKKGYEAEPLEQLSDDYVWDTQDSLGANALRYLAHVYSFVPEGYSRVNGDYLDAATDDAVSSQTTPASVTLVAQGGGYDQFNSFESYGFTRFYQGIRAASVFMANIDKVPIKIPNANKNWKAEARFLRAYYYFELVKRYGGVPLMGDKIYNITDDVQLPRSTFDQCITYIVSECDAVKEDLRVDPVDIANLGRVTKGAALALKARALLYAASPLYNHTANDSGLPSGSDAQLKAAGYNDFDANRWKLAADAARDIITYGKFSLAVGYNNVFLQQLSNEIIFARNANSNTSVENTNGPVGFSGNVQGNGRTSPTQEFVDAFLTINGKPISEDVVSATNPSGYDANNPYNNRDPRFKLSVIYNGAQWIKTTIQTFDGGVSKPGGALQQTYTSYYLRKFMGNFENAEYASVYHNFPLFRYAEVYLNLAEAKNEFLGSPDAEVYNAIVELRKRAGIIKGAGTYGYGLKDNMTKDEMRTVIRNERRIELSFEEHRFWDIRRWRIGQQVLANNLHGLRILRSNAGVLTTTGIEVLKTNFGDTKRYLYPIPFSELSRNSKLVQNPGW